MEVNLPRSDQEHYKEFVTACEGAKMSTTYCHCCGKMNLLQPIAIVGISCVLELIIRQYLHTILIEGQPALRPLDDFHILASSCCNRGQRRTIYSYFNSESFLFSLFKNVSIMF